MSNRFLKSIVGSIGFILLTSVSVQIVGQAPQVEPKKDWPVTLGEIVRTLKFTSRQLHSIDEINRDLIAAVKKRKINFVFNDNVRKELKDNQANDALIKTVDKVLSPAEKTALGEHLKVLTRLDAILRENWSKKDIESRQKVIQTGKEILEKFGNDKDEDLKDMIKWLRDTLPRLEEKLNSASQK